MARFEDAIMWVMSGARVRRRVWASVNSFTQSTPPLAIKQQWRIWCIDGEQIIGGWGGQVGAALAPDDPIRDGCMYRPSDEDRLATDWEVCT